VHYIPVHTQPDFRALGFRRGQFPASEAYYSRCLSLPMFAALTDGEQRQVHRALQGALS
jgi:dTDP-4-amino-4,6-dideoxygalactose transaminase